MWGFFSTKYSMIKHSASKEMDKKSIVCSTVAGFYAL
jgi:hypothetical protein